MINYKNFVSNSHCLLIAPAGYGKTHTISECLKYTNGKQLILTHTNAGVAAIKERIKKNHINSNNYHVETISSYAQKYVLAFYTKKDIPEQEKTKEYYPFIIEKCKRLFELKSIQKIIANTYNGVFVDEYQDCTTEQHNLILILSELLPIRVFGDYLQGIFEFNECLVDLRCTKTMCFIQSKYELKTPWRWKNGKNVELGEDLKQIREKLLNEEKINLNEFSSIEVKILNKTFYEKDIREEIYQIINHENNVLFILPNSTNINSRVEFVKKFKNINLLEAIDDKDYYKMAKCCDQITTDNIHIIMKKISDQIFNKTEIRKWLKADGSGLVQKKALADKCHLKNIYNEFELLKGKISNSHIEILLKNIKNLPGVVCYRKDLFDTLCSALIESEKKEITVYEAMVNIKNINRRLGRKVTGKWVGTTLLTKGLEFDTVLIIDAHKFNSPKNLYVALTRASKRLVVYTKNKVLSPYNKVAEN